MRLYASADSARIEGDEDGFHLVIDTDEGDVLDLRIQGIAIEFAEEVDSTVGAWWREGQAAGATRPRRITEEDLDAYPLGSPKRITLEREIDRQR